MVILMGFNGIYGGLMGSNGIYPLVMTNIAIENDHLWWIFPLKMVIFHSYVNLPEGNSKQCSIAFFFFFFGWLKAICFNDLQ